MWNLCINMILFWTGLLPAGRVDSLPFDVKAKADDIAMSLNQEAAVDFNLRLLPATLEEWTRYKRSLREKIWKACGVEVSHTLPLDVHETGVIRLDGYSIHKIYFQTRPGVYATADLYVPDGKGPFPAVINMHGHWPGGKAGDMVQSCAHELALNGYVCLNIDAWGSGERGTIPGVEEYHGSNLGASLMDIGESLLGAQLVDNMRGVDLLCSLKYVDSTKIGATGASGGGNQTMWLSAMDDRIKASMPVVNVGTFEAYIMASNCVCELLPGGLTFTEESGVLGLIAPRALKICSALRDKNKAFFPSEMLRSYTNARPIYDLYGAKNNITYSLFDTTHGYWPAMRTHLLGWFDLYLKGKGNGSPIKEIPFNRLPDSVLMVFKKGQRDSLVKSTVQYVHQRAAEISRLQQNWTHIDPVQKIVSLKHIIFYNKDSVLTYHPYKVARNWEYGIIETVNKHLIPLKLYEHAKRNNRNVLVLFTNENDSAKHREILNTYMKNGYNVAVADLWGLGGNASALGDKIDGALPRFHTMARASYWLGKSVQGEWASEIELIIQFLQHRYGANLFTIDAQRELGIAALVHADIFKSTDRCVLRDMPLSYIVNQRAGMDYFNMSTHLPGIIPWGDISLLAALSGCRQLEFHAPVTMNGDKIDNNEFLEFEKETEHLQFISKEKRCQLKFIK